MNTDFQINSQNNNHDNLIDALNATKAKVGQTVAVKGWGYIEAIYRRVDLRTRPTNRYGEPLTDGWKQESCSFSR